MEKFITLFELNSKIGESIKSSFPDTLWVLAEISEIKIHYSGHCYLELIEKDPKGEKIKARAKATIWSYSFRMLKPYFETTTGHELSVGLKILIKANVEFHEVYGFSLNIFDIDPSYTIGDLARKRQEIIKRLETEGVLNMNKEIHFPLVPQKIAVISSQTAAGYKDFVHQLENNIYHYKFYLKLFPALMQGAEAEKSIVDALEKVYIHEKFFDAVAILRGGGSQADLSCFDSYWLAYHITQFPIPVITGIGHEKDETIADLVAHTKLKTPTAAAEFFISVILDFETSIHELKNQFTDIVNSQIQGKKSKLENLGLKISPFVQTIIMKYIKYLSIIEKKSEVLLRSYIRTYNTDLQKLFSMTIQLSETFLRQKQNFLQAKINSLPLLLNQILVSYKHKLEILNKSSIYLNPENILKKGYSITYSNSKVIKNVRQLKKGDLINTKFYRGETESEIRKITDSKKQDNTGKLRTDF
jgi:exodeoxyribonuclease VII large subunit